MSKPAAIAQMTIHAITIPMMHPVEQPDGLLGMAKIKKIERIKMFYRFSQTGRASSYH